MSVNVWKIFALNSVLSMIVVAVAVTIQDRYDKFTDHKDRDIKRTTSYKSFFLTMTGTFLASMIVYIIMYFMFGFVGGAQFKE